MYETGRAAFREFLRVADFCEDEDAPYHDHYLSLALALLLERGEETTEFQQGWDDAASLAAEQDISLA